MTIKKMLLLASMALAAIAFAAPVAAQANVQLTEPSGTPLKVNDRVTVTSTDLRTTVGENTLECGLVTLHYRVAENGPNHVTLNPTAAHNANTENCVTVTPFGTFENHISNAGTGQVTIDTSGTAEVPSTFTSETTTPFGPQHCEYAGAVHLQGTSGTDIVHIGPSPLASPTCEEGTIHGTGTVERSNGQPVIIDF